MTVTRQGLSGKWELDCGGRTHQPLFYITDCTDAAQLCVCETSMSAANEALTTSLFSTITVYVNSTNRINYVNLWFNTPGIWKDEWGNPASTSDSYNRGSCIPLLNTKQTFSVSLSAIIGQMRGAAETPNSGICNYGCVSVEVDVCTNASGVADGWYHVSGGGS